MYRKGLAVAVGVVIAFVVFPLLVSLLWPWRDDNYIWLLPWLAIPVAGYLVAIVATVRRSTRSFGQGMLLGLTVLLIVGLALLLAIVGKYGYQNG